jgi:gliding motility-associated-like protein
MKKAIIGMVLGFASTAGSAQELLFKRVCNAGNNNQLTWQNKANTCTNLGPIKLFAKENVAQAYFLINNNINLLAGNFTHVNANAPAVKDWHYYFEYTQICGIDTLVILSDTLKIDDIKPDSTILDSVSVDPINNVVLLGWSRNKTADFNAYYLYNYDRADPRLIENYRDTFYIDITPINPRSKSLSYDITSSDSCDNRKEYGAYQHKTIHLRGSVDTCINQIRLNWTAYVGWPVINYHVFRSINNAPFEWIAELPGNQLNFQEQITQVGANVKYFIRARKENNTMVSSSSNMSPELITGKSVSPTNTILKQVSNNNNNKIELEIIRNPVANYLNIELRRINSLMVDEQVYVFPNNEIIFEDVFADNTMKYDYYLLSRNMCGVVTDSTPFSNNIVLSLKAHEDKISLNWNRYFTWNTGVKEYIMYRASGNNINDAINFTAEQGGITDSLLETSKGSLAANCFYVVAKQDQEDANSKSNTVCLIKAGNVFYPNAIIPNGLNKVFTFVGEGIDLQLSSISIFNRWGQIEYLQENILNGWDGKNNNGNDVPAGVYFFIAKIKVGTEIKDINGNITVIR